MNGSTYARVPAASADADVVEEAVEEKPLQQPPPPFPTQSGEGREDGWGSSAPASPLPSRRPRLCSLVLLSGAALLLLTSVALLLAAIGLSLHSSKSSSPASDGRSALLPVTRGRLLVVVVHLLGQPPMIDQNLRYLVSKGIRCWQDADYVIVLQRNDAATFLINRSDTSWMDGSPPLPPNGRYVLHENLCMDWGSLGWLLSLPPTHPDYVDTSRYRYFAMLNTGVRGPLLPDFLEEHMDLYARATCDADAAQREGLFAWYDVFLSKIRGAVRYVGCTLNCQFAPHVQSYAVFMDFVALQVLWRSQVPNDWLLFEPSNSTLRNASRHLAVEERWSEWNRTGGLLHLPPTGNVFKCHDNKDDTIMVSEIGSSQAILRAGYNLAVMMRQWSGVDFRVEPSPCEAVTQARGWAASVDPLHYGSHIHRTQRDGPKVTLDPLEVVFGKRKGGEWPGYHQRLEALLSWENNTWWDARGAGGGEGEGQAQTLSSHSQPLLR